jgi:phosphatidylserine/phosphatidylglycerophosphate/cardiolipin synthase-like enzyme
MRTPAYWGKLGATTYRWLWHDVHTRLEGLITKDLEREFVLRWNREKDQSVVRRRPGWKPLEMLAASSPTAADRSAARNGQQLQMLRTVSTQGTGRIQNTRRDDIWQGYQLLIGCGAKFLYMENQYFREPRMADAIVKQARAQADLVVIVVVPSETDDMPDAGKKHGDARQHEFFLRLTKGIQAGRLRVYTMFHRIIHSKFIMADDRVLCVGSANANPRGFFLDSELNVTLDDAAGVQAFRHRLWAHNLGLPETTVAAWAPAAFIAGWDAVARANEGFRSSPEKMTGEAVVPFDPLMEKGETSPFIDDVETEWGAADAGYWARRGA